MSEDGPQPAPREERRLARRIDTTRWRDPRLAIGLVLIATALGGTTWLVSTLTARQDIYVATRPVSVGERLAEADLTIAEVNIGTRVSDYLDAATPLPGTWVATRSLAPGEFVPRSAMGMADQLDVRAVPIRISGPMPAGLRVGGQVDLWQLPTSAPSVSEPSGGPSLIGEAQPAQIATSLVVREIQRPAAAIGLSGGEATVHVLVPLASLPDVIGASAAAERLVLVPVPAGGDGG